MADETKVVIGKDALVRFSYLYAFTTRHNDLSGKDEYSAAILIPKKSPDIPKIKAAMNAAAKAKFGDEIPKKFKWPLRDGDEEREDDPAYKGMYFINAKSTQQPGVVDAKLQPILSPNDFTSGDWGRASVNFYGFDQKGNRGVGAGLQNLQKVKDGDPLTSKSSADDDFAGLAGGDDDGFLS